jgi:hypothetical protein
MPSIHNHIGGATPDWHYRAVLPTAYCWRELAAEGIRLFGQNGYALGERFDAYLVHRHVDMGLMSYLDVIRDTGRRVIWELDDNLWAVPPNFPASKEIAAARENIDLLREWSSTIIVSTPELARVVARPEKTVVCPNLADVRAYPPLPPRRPGPVRVLWAGANAVDADLVSDAVLRLQREMAGNVHFYFWQVAPPRLQGRVFVLHSVPFAEWPKRLVEFGADIVLAPLTDHPFSRCKSELKYLEMSLAGIAGVYSDLPPYACVKDGETGLKVPLGGDWYDPIRHLIEDAELRLRIATAARTDVLANHSWEQPTCRLEWMDAFRRAVA